VVKTADEVAKEDMETLFHGMPAQSARVTRFRADLAHAALDRDLVLSASADQATLEPFRQAKSFTSQPAGCPAGCYVDNAPLPPAPPAAEPIAVPTASGSSCATGATHPTGCIALGLGAVAFAAMRRRRRHVC
jgi:MYXO-CTERM domain-containing protein